MLNLVPFCWCRNFIVGVEVTLLRVASHHSHAFIDQLQQKSVPRRLLLLSQHIIMTQPPGTHLVQLPDDSLLVPKALLLGPHRLHCGKVVKLPVLQQGVRSQQPRKAFSPDGVSKILTRQVLEKEFFILL
jgi:hypothetical protein